MKSLINFLIVLLLALFLSACGGKKNKVDSNGVGRSATPSGNPIIDGDASLLSFREKVVAGHFVPIPTTVYTGGPYGGNVPVRKISFMYNSVNYWGNFTREYYASGGYFRYDGLPNDASVLGELVAAIDRSEGANLCGDAPMNPAAYKNAFGRDYDINECYAFYSANEVFFIDLNYPIIANPTYFIKTNYSVNQGSWWSYGDYTQQYNVSGYRADSWLINDGYFY